MGIKDDAPVELMSENNRNRVFSNVTFATYLDLQEEHGHIVTGARSLQCNTAERTRKTATRRLYHKSKEIARSV